MDQWTWLRTKHFFQSPQGVGLSIFLAIVLLAILLYAICQWCQVSEEVCCSFCLHFLKLRNYRKLGQADQDPKLHIWKKGEIFWIATMTIFSKMWESSLRASHFTGRGYILGHYLCLRTTFITTEFTRPLEGSLTGTLCRDLWPRKRPPICQEQKAHTSAAPIRFSKSPTSIFVTPTQGNLYQAPPSEQCNVDMIMNWNNGLPKISVRR